MPLYPLSFTLEDDYGRKTTRSFLLNAVDFPAAQAAAAAFAVDYNGATMLALTETRLTDVNAVAGSPDVGANVDEGATFSCSLATPNKFAATKLPGVIEAARLTGGVIDLSNALIALYVGHFTSGVVTLSDGETVTAFIKGVLDR